MARSTMIHAQADAAEAMIDRIVIGIAGYAGDGSAFPLSLDVARLGNILRIHYSIADRQLYPLLIRCGGPRAVRIAHEFQREVSVVGGRFDRFRQRWSSSSAIAGDVAQFRVEAEAMMALLRDRLGRERRDLYPLVDAVVEPAVESLDDWRSERRPERLSGARLSPGSPAPPPPPRSVRR